VTDHSSSESEREPVGLLADRLAALAHLFAVPVHDRDELARAGVVLPDSPALTEDELAADHYRVLSHDLMPDAGVFLEDEGMLGGSLATELHGVMADQGFTPDDTTRSTGHAVNELGFMAHLLHAGRVDEAYHFWHDHAAGWLPLVALHLSRSGSAWFEAVANSLKTCMAALSEIAPASSDEQPLIPDALPEPGLDLQEAKVGLARIGSFLAVPARSGLVLSRTRLAQLGRSFRLPTGFGSRSRIVEGLLRSGAQYEGWTAVCNALLEECDETKAVWSAMEGAGRWSALWTERLAFTRSVLVDMRDAEEEVS